MRKILFLIVPLLFFVCSIQAQQLNNANDNAAFQLVSASKSTLGLTDADITNMKVSSTYLDNTTGITMVYMQQTYLDIPVYNQILVLAFRNGKLLSQAGAFNHSLAKLSNVKTGMPSVTAAGAVQSALSDRGFRATQMAVAVKTEDNGRKIEFTNMGVSSENITAQLTWSPVENSLAFHLAWQVYIVPKTTSDYWMVRVDASDNKILGLDNYTVYDHWGSPVDNSNINYPSFATDYLKQQPVENKTINLFDFKKSNGPSLITTATYRVVPFPAESPWHPGGGFALRTDPWLAAPGNATTLKWHTGLGGTDYDYSRGNNVWAYEDRTAPTNTGTVAKSAASTTPLPSLTFNYVPDTTVDPTQNTPVPNQRFNITNVFYWNNIIHDVLYQYGFTEPAGNFQDDNQGRGGAGNDHVNAEAQDGSGTNNANFSTPADGGSGRMQMYLWNLGGSSPNKDGDIDNGIVIHEFSHGLSNRLTGGPAAAGCLGNAEQMGEGWSDYYSLMLTQNWATSTLTTGFNTPRGIGLYALNGTNLFGGSAPGTGIRHFRYCTDFTINSQVYLANLPTSPHDRGEIWCATLWDMTWNIINQAGTINPNLYNTAGGGGNIIAMRLVTEGMKLQQCSPGFISGRDAILQADQILYGGTYYCAIWEAFRRRGMGAFASEGSTSSVTDQVPDFSPPVSLGAVASATTIPEGQNIIYTNSITTCLPITGYTLRDTLPNNVTYVSGGTYDAPNRVVSFSITQAAGSTNYPFTVNVNPGSYFPPVTLINEVVAGATLPTGWSTNGTPAGLWTSVATSSNSAPNSLFAPNLAVAGDSRLETPTIALPINAHPKLSFWHRFNTEDGWDGGVVEISTNGGTTWTDLGPNMITNGYNGALGAAPTNALSGRSAFTGTTPGVAFINTIVSLAAYSGQSVKIRFRFGSDDNTSAPTLPAGWWVDDIVVNAVAAVNMRSSIFNATNVRVSFKNMVTEITQLVVCAPNITQQPVNVTTCAASNTSFTCVATATGGVTYQWQESTNGGTTWTNVTNGGIYSGATASTLNLTAVTIIMNNYRYRCFVTGSCAPTATSSAAILTVVANTVGGTISPANTPVCGTTNSGILTLSGNNGPVIRWESSINGGTTWTSISNTTNTYTFNNVTTTTLFRAVSQVNGCTSANSSNATVTFTASSPIVIAADPGTTICEGDPTRLTVSASALSTFSNTTPILVPGIGTSGPGSPYPSNITVSGFPTSGVTVQSVTLSNITHTWESDISVLLQSPTGTNVILMSSVTGNEGGGFGIINKTFTFSDGAAAGLAAGVASGTYKPTNNSTTRNWPAPGPGVVVQGVNPLLSTFTGDFNGIWKLYAFDAVGGDAGQIAGGYSIDFQALSPVTTGTFLWSPAAGLSSTTTNPTAASPMNTTTYTVMHDNGAGCVRQASILITVNKRPVVITQPASTSSCVGSSVTFTVAGTGTNLTYQWQLSTNGGTTWTNLANTAPYSNVTTATLTINPVTLAMNTYRYRCVLGGTCPGNGVANISNGAILTVNALPTVTVTPTTGCGGIAGTNGLLLTASGANTYTWSPIAGLYTNANTSTIYIGGNTPTVYAAPSTFTAYTVTGTNTTTGCSNTATALVNYTPPAPTVTPSSVTMCLGDPAVRLISSSSSSTIVNFTTGTINVPVPDNDPAGASSTLAVSGIPAGATIGSMRVTFNMTHTWDGDMVIVLKAPNNNILNLDYYLSTTGGTGATTGFTNTVISSAGTAALSSGSNPYTGTFRADAVVTGPFGPSGPTGMLPTGNTWTQLYSIPNGTWTLGMYDGGVGDLGVLTNWSINMTYILGVPATPAVWTPAAGLFNDALASSPYVAGTPKDTVWTKPTPSGVYNYQATVQSLGLPPSSITTTFANNNQFALVTSNFKNNNGFPVTITGIESIASTSGGATARLYYKTTPVNGAPGAITAANGWILAGTGTYTAVANTTTTTPQPMLSGLSVMVPPGATYGIAFESQVTGGAGNLRYSTVAAGTYTDSGGGCDVISGTNVSFAGDLAPNAPTFTPRAFIGKVLFNGGSSVPCTSPARTVTVTVNQPTSVSTQPISRTICTDKVATFTVAAAGTGPFAYQWQVSTNGGNTYTNITNGGVYSGATTATLTITAPPTSMSGYYYRAVITGAAPCASATSNQALLTVNPLPVVTISASPLTSLFPGLRTTLSSTVSPNAAATYTWLRNGVAVTGATTGTLPVDIDGLGEYSLTVTDVNGCTASSNKVTIKDSVSGRVFIYPSPNAGLFQVRYYSVPNNVLPRGINIYNSAGSRILVQTYSVTAPYARMDVDLRKYGKGVYWVEVVDRNGNRLAMGRTVVQ